jgi:hypothetical protein
MTPSLSPAPELSAGQVRKTVDLSPLAFTTTADLEPQTALVGQERAVQALQMGIAMPPAGLQYFRQ